MNPTHVQPPPFQPHAWDEPLPENPDVKTLLETLLRRPAALAGSLGGMSGRAAGIFLLIAFVSFVLFGVVIGCFAKHEQLWAAPLKITLGVFFAGAICYPSLYIFSTLAGARTTPLQLASSFAGALALAGLLLLGFAPAIWIFAESSTSFGFIGTLGIGAWGIAVIFAIRFLRSIVAATGGTQRAPLWIWSGVFLLVSLQMTTSLRPILGRSPDFMTQEKRFFLQHWADQFTEVLKP